MMRIHFDTLLGLAPKAFRNIKDCLLQKKGGKLVDEVDRAGISASEQTNIVAAGPQAYLGH